MVTIVVDHILGQSCETYKELRGETFQLRSPVSAP